MNKETSPPLVAPTVIDGWTRVDHSNPASVPQGPCYVLVGMRTPFDKGPGYHVTESFFVPDWKSLAPRSGSPPSRKTCGKYSRHFGAAWMGYEVLWWMVKPRPPELTPNPAPTEG